MKSNVFVLFFATIFIAHFVFIQCNPSPVEKSNQEQCMEEIGVSDDEVESNLENPKVKCVLACMMKKVGLLEDEKMILERVLETFMPKIEKDILGRENALKDCTRKANERSNECDTAMSMFQCIRKIPAM